MVQSVESLRLQKDLNAEFNVEIFRANRIIHPVALLALSVDMVYLTSVPRSYE